MSASADARARFAAPSLARLPKSIVIMGVSGCGKSTLGAALAAKIGYSFVEGDDLHPTANVAKMTAGIPLDDADRWPWLDRVAAALRSAPEGAVVTCSALKRSYRDRIRSGSDTPPAFVHLALPLAILRQRMLDRPGHFMPASLLDSQLATLEVPALDERAVTPSGVSLGELVDATLAGLVAIAGGML